MAANAQTQTWDAKANTAVNNAVQKAGNVASGVTNAAGSALGVGTNAIGAGVKMAAGQVGNIVKPVANVVAPVAQKVAGAAKAAAPAVKAYASQQAQSRAKGIQEKNENLDQSLADEYDRFAAESRENKQRQQLEANKDIGESTSQIMSVEAREKGDEAVRAAGPEGGNTGLLRLEKGTASAQPAREFAQSQKENAQSREQTSREQEAQATAVASDLRKETDQYAVADAFNADVEAQAEQAEQPPPEEPPPEEPPPEEPPPEEPPPPPPEQPKPQENTTNAKDIVSKDMPPEALAILGNKPRLVPDAQLEQINKAIRAKGGTGILPSTALKQGEKGFGVGGRWWPGKDSEGGMKLASQHNQTTAIPAPSPPASTPVKPPGSDIRIKNVKKPKKGTTNGVAIDPHTEYEAELKEMAKVLASHRGFY